MRKLILLFCGLTISGISASAQIYTKAQLEADADTLFTTIFEVHPDMFAVYPEEEFVSQSIEIKNSFSDGMTSTDFYRLVAPLIARLGDGHTGLFPPLYDIDPEEKILFPLMISFDQNSSNLIVTERFRYKNTVIPEGARILSVNGREGNQILHDFIGYIPGERDFYRIRALERSEGLSNYLFYAVYGETVFDIVYETEGKIERATTGLHSKKDLTGLYRRHLEPLRSDYSFFVIADTIALIEFNSFRDIHKFVEFMQESFGYIKDNNIRHLIIDIRQNGGGDSNLGDLMFQYISPGPFRQFGKTIAKFSRQVNNRYFAGKEISYPDGYILTYDNHDLIKLRENDLRYEGNVWLLIGKSTFSSASKFSWAFKYFDMGTVVGEETGGLAVTFGDSYTDQLPNTGLKYSSSWKRFYSYGSTDEDLHGTIPDHEVPEEQALDFVLEFIKGMGK